MGLGNAYKKIRAGQQWIEGKVEAGVTKGVPAMGKLIGEKAVEGQQMISGQEKYLDEATLLAKGLGERTFGQDGAHSIQRAPTYKQGCSETCQSLGATRE